MSDASSAPKFTVFTATFNQACTLPRLHASLARQTFGNFEWLIVDDGSTDGTAELVDTWLSGPDLRIRYVHKPHGGKHTAWNQGVDLAQGQLFLSIGPGDSCTPDALQVFDDVWESIDPHQRETFTGVCCLVMDPNGDIVGDRFPTDVFDSDSNALRFRHHIGGAKWGFHRVAVVREFRLPNVDNRRSVPESIIWGRIASRYQERFINQALLVCHPDAEVPQSGRSWLKPESFALSTQVAIEEHARRWFFHDPVFFLKAGANFSRNSWHIGTGLVAQRRRLKGPAARALWLIMLPVGWTLHRRDVARQNAMSQRLSRVTTSESGAQMATPAGSGADIINRALYSQASVVEDFRRRHGFLDLGEQSVLARVANDVRGKPVLDLGVGAGRTVPLLYLLSADYVGVDYSPEMVEVCRSHYPGRRFLQLDARDLSTLPSEYFSLAFFSFNGLDLIGLDGRLKAIAEVRRVLAPGGYLVFSSHNYDGPDMAIRPWHLGQIAPRGLARGLLDAPQQVSRFRRSIANYRRLAPLSVDDGRQAVAPNPGHDYSLLMYYGSRTETLTDLTRAGFEAVEVFTDTGTPVGDDTDITQAPWLYYVARIPLGDR